MVNDLKLVGVAFWLNRKYSTSRKDTSVNNWPMNFQVTLRTGIALASISTDLAEQVS